MCRSLRALSKALATAAAAVFAAAAAVAFSAAANSSVLLPLLSGKRRDVGACENEDYGILGDDALLSIKQKGLLTRRDIVQRTGHLQERK